MCPNLIILEDSQKSYPPCSLGSALGWLLALLLMCLDWSLNLAAYCPRDDPEVRLRRDTTIPV